MKKQTILSIAYITLMSILLSSCSDESTSAETDTFDASVVCPANLRGTFVDERDGQEYKYVTIGNQVWMAENLKFDAPYSLCYEKNEGFCDTFGRFYSLHENGEYIGLFDQELLDTICPAGWHVPSVDEWSVLINDMGGEKKALSRLYSSEDFDDLFIKSSDDCGFNSLPAGVWNLDGSLGGGGVSSVYWTSTAENLSVSFGCFFSYNGIAFSANYPKMSIRCVKD